MKSCRRVGQDVRRSLNDLDTLLHLDSRTSKLFPCELRSGCHGLGNWFPLLICLVRVRTLIYEEMIDFLLLLLYYRSPLIY